MGIGVVVHRRTASASEHGEYLGVGTNNIAELIAIERGAAIAIEARTRRRRARMRVYTDSSYSIGVLAKGWKAKANQELIARMRKLLAAVRNVEFVKVPGHAGVPENERCDELARTAILRAGSCRSGLLEKQSSDGNVSLSRLRERVGVRVRASNRPRSGCDLLSAFVAPPGNWVGTGSEQPRRTAAATSRRPSPRPSPQAGEGAKLRSSDRLLQQPAGAPRANHVTEVSPKATRPCAWEGTRP